MDNISGKIREFEVIKKEKKIKKKISINDELKTIIEIKEKLEEKYPDKPNKHLSDAITSLTIVISDLENIKN